MARFGQLDTQYFDASGDPLSGGKIYFFESGTTTPKTTYADINNSIPNTHPVILDAAGRQPNIFFDGVAKATLTDSSDVTIVTRDPVGETATNFGDEGVSTRIYSANDVVIASDGQYYRSLQSANQNNNPVSTSGYWTLLYSVEWNSGITYGVSAVVTYDNQQYQSLQATNVNHQPDTSPAWWVPLNFAWDATATYADNQNVVGTDGILYTSQQASNLNHDPTDAGNRPTWWVGTSADAAASAAAAATSEANAATSESNAATSATNSANSATASATSATNSANSATASATSASNAATSETNAANSATSASTSATNAATSETNAANSATAAATSASNAATSETNAGNSATAAATSETNAANSATAAATSATNAANSATAAGTSETNAANSASAASTSATNAANSATASANSATASAASAALSEAAWDQFDDTYLGQKASDPTVDNDGNPLATGALYFNTTSNELKVYDGASWLSTTYNSSNVAITGGSINGTTIGATTPSTGSFSSLNVGGSDVVVDTDIGVTVQAYDATIVVDADIGVTVQAYDADTTKNDVANTFTAVQTFDNGIIEEFTAVTSTTNSTTVNLQDGTNFSHTLTENTTFTFSNPAASGKVSAFTLKIVQDASASGYTVTWPAAVDWPSATAPTLTATASAVDYFVFITHDGGTTWYGFTAGQGMA